LTHSRSGIRRLGLLALQGWRQRVAGSVAPPVARRTPLAEDDVRAFVGLVLLGLGAWYVASTLARFARGV
jgi:hypothetical protein